MVPQHPMGKGTSSSPLAQFLPFPAPNTTCPSAASALSSNTTTATESQKAPGLLFGNPQVAQRFVAAPQVLAVPLAPIPPLPTAMAVLGASVTITCPLSKVPAFPLSWKVAGAGAGATLDLTCQVCVAGPGSVLSVGLGCCLGWVSRCLSVLLRMRNKGAGGARRHLGHHLTAAVGVGRRLVCPADS